METESCHSNQSSYLTGTKNNCFVESNARESISFIKQTVSEEKIFKDFFKNLSFLGPQQPNKISDQDEGHLKCRALLNTHFSKNKNQISPMRKQKFAISTFFHYKSMGRISCNGNQSSYPI